MKAGKRDLLAIGKRNQRAGALWVRKVYKLLLLFIALAFVLHMILIMALPLHLSETPPHRDAKVLRPSSNAYGRIWLYTKPQRPGIDESPVTILMALDRLRSPTAYAGSLEIYLPNLAYRYYDASNKCVSLPGLMEAHLSIDGILTWMQSCDVDIDNTQVRAEAAELHAVLQRLACGASLEETSGKMFNFQVETKVLVGPMGFTGPAWLVWAEIFFWLVLSLFGLVYLRRRSSRNAVQESSA